MPSRFSLLVPHRSFPVALISSLAVTGSSCLDFASSPRITSCLESVCFRLRLLLRTWQSTSWSMEEYVDVKVVIKMDRLSLRFHSYERSDAKGWTDL